MRNPDTPTVKPIKHHILKNPSKTIMQTFLCVLFGKLKFKLVVLQGTAINLTENLAIISGEGGNLCWITLYLHKCSGLRGMIIQSDKIASKGKEV